jgi:prolyl oligopeptidase
VNLRTLALSTFLALHAACSHAPAKSPTPTPAPPAQPTPQADEQAWLESIDGEKSLAWVRARNAEAVAKYASGPAFEKREASLLEVFDSDARIPYVHEEKGLYYNFWKDKAHPRGLYRRTTLAEYKKAQPRWETVLDLDAVAKAENENWVWEGMQCLRPDFRHCLVSLSRGGADARVLREFDMKTKSFVAGGFTLPEAKMEVSWVDADNLYVATDFGPGTLTTSGYPRIVKRWKRGTPLTAATTVLECPKAYIGVGAFRDHTPGFVRDFAACQIDTVRSEFYWIEPSGKQTRVDIQPDAESQIHREWLLVQLRSPWTVGDKTYAKGAMVATRFDDFMKGKREMVPVFTPSATTSLADAAWTKSHLILNLLDNVASRIEVLTPQKGDWKREPLGNAPALSDTLAFGVDPVDSEDYFMNVNGFLEPAALYHGTIGKGHAEALKHAPAFFDASKYSVQQQFVVSKDGTRVPYFIVAPKDMKLDGSNPTLLTGYGGFEVSMTPSYSGAMGRGWLDRGGVYVLANIRGGGEYGPEWHQAALRQNRPRAYEDFAAVAADLVKRGVTSRAHLGAMGGSNGGLLMGNMLTSYADLWGAIVCQVPLLDMKRYTHLSAGASWIGEYGDPDKPEDWAYLKTYSPYQNVKAGVKYPPILFTTSTRDDRVGPVHARKMAARMLAMGDDVSFYENIEGGHAGAADHKQAAFMMALELDYLWAHIAR